MREQNDRPDPTRRSFVQGTQMLPPELASGLRSFYAEALGRPLTARMRELLALLDEEACATPLPDPKAASKTPSWRSVMRRT